MAEEQKPPLGDGSYAAMSRPMQKLWDERLYNVFKLRQSLLTGDSVLTWAYVFWIGFATLVGLLSLINSTRFPLRLDYCLALATFFSYYATIGFIRRNTESYLVTLCAQNPDHDCSSAKLLEVFKNRKPYRIEDDPPLARKAYELRDKFHLPRRGLAQSSIVLWQFVAGLGYAGNYVYYVLWKGDLSAATFSPQFWILNITVTGGGVLILLKNSGFLISVKKLVETVSSLAGNLLGNHFSNNIRNGK